MKTATVAVITGDLVNSSAYSQNTIQTIIQRLTNEFQVISQETGDDVTAFTLFRGDSFQGIVEDPSQALQIALRLKALINSFSDSGEEAGNTIPVSDVRISIGIGEASYDVNAINVSNGEAFQLSGRTLDSMKTKQLKMALTTPNSNINDEFRVHMKFLDSITDRWSMASAEVVYFLLKQLKEKQIAEQLNRSQAAINHRKKAAGWEEIRLLLQRFEQVIKSEFV
ncbi:hypothetical protein J1N09_06515 [Aureitalea sp. L0-47]|uniref:SatD family protein n=1 Tax=Aureitalea sp. L0-47 TaxID=2816962 RepID=UPI0022379B78|nr:SatD family protein [Aureitalea sp. L0-47]MCW5519483.1 hypothetical protein [Aureitalea sp. L0-47]